MIPVWDQQLGTLTWCLDQALRAVGGAPTYLLTDNAKTVTIEHVAGIPVRHPEMVALGRHYGCKVETCVPFDPESKGGVEATVKIAKADLVPTEANLLPAYDSFAELEEACRELCDQVNGRVHRETAAVPADRLAVERAMLHVLPAEPHALALGEERLVGDDQTVRFGSVRYSTPPGHVGTRVWCRVVGEELVIVARTGRGAVEIARHRLSTPGSPPICDEHYPHHPGGNGPRQPRPRPRTEAEAAFLAIGDGAQRWLVEAAASGAARIRSKMARAVELAAVLGAGHGRRGARPGRDRRPVRRRRPGLDPRPPGRRAGDRRGRDRRRGPLRPARHRRLGPPRPEGGGTMTLAPVLRPGRVPARPRTPHASARSLVRLLGRARAGPRQNGGPQLAAAVAGTGRGRDGLSRAPGALAGTTPTWPSTTSTSARTARSSPGDRPRGPPLPAELDALLRRMRLPYLRKAAPDVLATARAQRWDPAEVLRVLIAEEVIGRDAATRRMRRKTADFPSGKTFASWRPDESSIPAATQNALTTLEWIGRAENLVIAGPSGTGKSHFVEALAHAAIENDLRVAWFTLETLTAAIGRAKADGSIARTVARICRSDLIVVDDIGMLPAGQDAAEAFYRIIDAAYERRSIAVTSNIHPSGFDTIMPKTLATATVDRLLHHAHLVLTKGDSHRLAEALAGKGVIPLDLTPPAGRSPGHQPGILLSASPENTRPPNRISQWPDSRPCLPPFKTHYCRPLPS